MTERLRNTLTDIVIVDVADAFMRLKREPTPTLRRHAIRAVFAGIEGLLWQLKQGIEKDVERHSGLFSPGELSVLREEQYEVDDRGTVRTRQRFIPLERNIRLTVTLFQKIRPEYSLDLSHPGWDALKRSLHVRHRLTHPKRRSDLEVSDAELNDAHNGFNWFLALVIEILRETVDHLKPPPRGLISPSAPTYQNTYLSDVPKTHLLLPMLFSIGEEEKTKITSTPSAGAGYYDYGYGDWYGGSTVRSLLLPMPHWVSPKHLQRYLDEFAFRFDRRWKEAELFPRVLHCAIDTKPFPYYRLTAERSE